MRAPVWLGIDTATAWLTLAVWSPAEGRLLAGRELLAERRHAALLLPELHGLLEEAGLSLAEVNAIGVGIGPGSYTGLRVGLATAQGLASGLDCSLTGVDSLAAAAWGQLTGQQAAWLTLDARRGNVYAGLYERSGDSVVTIHEPLKIPAAELAERAQADGHAVLEAGAPSAEWTARSAAGDREPLALYL